MSVYAIVGIRTRYLGPTNYRGARIVADVPERIRTRNAFDEPASRWRLTMPYPHELSGVDAHEPAARALAERLGWDRGGEPVALAIDTGYVWDFPAARP